MQARGVRVTHPGELRVEVASGAMTRLEGVSTALGGAEGIHMAIATIPPGCQSSAHRHTNCESAIYVVRGHGRFLAGERLEEELDIGPGDFVYIPRMAVHAPVNDGQEPMELIVARNASSEDVEAVDLPVASGFPR